MGIMPNVLKLSECYTFLRMHGLHNVDAHDTSLSTCVQASYVLAPHSSLGHAQAVSTLQAGLCTSSWGRVRGEGVQLA